MPPLRDLWLAVRGTAFVIAQVVTLGVVAMVLGLLALNAIVRTPAAVLPPPPGPSRPLQALIPTLVPEATATPLAQASPTQAVALYIPPALHTPTPTVPTVAPTATPEPAAPTATPRPAAPTATTAPPARPEPTRAGTAIARAPTATSAVPGQMMKVLPAADGLPARVRAQPRSSAEILVRVPLGSTVEVLGTATGDEVQPGNSQWVLVKWKDVKGYVYSTLVGQP